VSDGGLSLLSASLAPAAAALALSLAVARRRERRRRRKLNERLHELRRPLQALALAAPSPPPAGPDPLELALAALRDLDAEINGGRPELRRRPVEARMLALAAWTRWRRPAARAGRRLEVSWCCGDALVDVDPVRIAQAIDNLIANALEHGRGTVTIEGRRSGAHLELRVRDRGGSSRSQRAAGRDPRRGHGLRVARAIGERHGGELRWRRLVGGSVASLRLPLVESRAAAAPRPARPVRVPGRVAW
jgi:signal transduction histidine kinase